MSTSIKTNVTVKADQEGQKLAQTKVQPEMSLAVVLKTAGAAKRGIIEFVYAVTLYVLNVNYMRDVNDKAYMSKAKAVEFMEAEILKQTTVKAGMLGHYVRTGLALYDRIIGAGSKPTAFGLPIVKAMAAAANTADGIEGVTDLLDSTLAKSMGKNPDFKDLSVALGFKSFAPKEQTPQTPAVVTQKIVDNVSATAKRVATLAKDGKITATQERKVTEAVAQVVTNPLDLARAAVERYSKLDTAEPSDLLDLVKFCEKVVDMLIAKQKADKAAAKAGKAKDKSAKAKAPVAAVKAKAKAPAVQTGTV